MLCTTCNSPTDEPKKRVFAGRIAEACTDASHEVFAKSAPHSAYAIWFAAFWKGYRPTPFTDPMLLLVSSD